MNIRKLLIIFTLLLSACGTNGPLIFGREDSAELSELPAVKVRWTPEIEYSLRYFLVIDKDFMPEAYERRGDYYGSIRLAFDEMGVPAELINVALVESRFVNKSKSSYGAAGIWQLMPQTARQYGLTVNFFRDQRYNPEEASYAAAKYLRTLYKQFGDWELALAAYNAGDNRIKKIIQDNGERDFWKLVRMGVMPSQTKAFVSRVNAAILIERKGLVASIKNFKSQNLAEAYEMLKSA